MVTGVGSAYIKNGLYELPCIKVPEFQAIGLGGLYLSGLDEALCVSMGTGTALVHARRGKQMRYLGGTGVGGGTLIGLSKLLTGAESIEHIIELAKGGDLSNIDLRIRDITSENNLDELSRDLTAANFGNVSDLAKKSDLCAGLVNLVLETVGMVSTFGARSAGVKNVVLTGNMTKLDLCKIKFEQFNRMYENEGMRFIIPELSPYATVIGTALADLK